MNPRNYVLRLAIAGQIQALGGEEEGADPNLEKFEPVLEQPTSPALSSSVGMPSPFMGREREGSFSNGSVVAGSGPLQELMRVPGNKVCADCCAPDPSWVSASFGVFLCKECAGIHRRMPWASTAALHSIRSIANRPDAIDLKTLGNSAANAKYERNVPQFLAHPTASDP